MNPHDAACVMRIHCACTLAWILYMTLETLDPQDDFDDMLLGNGFTDRIAVVQHRRQVGLFTFEP